MKKWFFKILILSLLLFISCDKIKTPPREAEQTVFLYMPWSTNLTSCFEKNIRDLELAIKRKNDENVRVVCLFANTSNHSILFEMRNYDDGYAGGSIKIRENTYLYGNKLKEYNVGTFKTEDELSSLLADVKAYAPSDRYSMIISAHGSGWLPVDGSSKRNQDRQKMHWENDGDILTRFFGGKYANYQTDIVTLADAVNNQNLYFEYIMFDACYMSNIEVAYELKDIADYLIASPTEIMGPGFPYAEMGRYLLGEVNYKEVLDGFYEFYLNYDYPYATIALIDLHQVDGMAEIMKEINRNYDASRVNTYAIQEMDGYSPVIFYDFEDYVEELCNDPILLNKFDEQLKILIPYALHTDNFFVGKGGCLPINTYSGITISDISMNSLAAKKQQTSWYKTTH